MLVGAAASLSQFAAVLALCGTAANPAAVLISADVGAHYGVTTCHPGGVTVVSVGRNVAPRASTRASSSRRFHGSPVRRSGFGRRASAEVSLADTSSIPSAKVSRLGAVYLLDRVRFPQHAVGAHDLALVEVVRFRGGRVILVGIPHLSPVGERG